MKQVQWLDYVPWREKFAGALDPRMYRIEHLDARIDDDVKLFTCPEAALILELRHYPTGAFDGHVLVAAGDAEAIVNILRPRAEACLRAIGAMGAIVESRAGWERALRPHGYSKHQTMVRKEL
jgi:hypothetical protein